jgi:hypothetical protein
MKREDWQIGKEHPTALGSKFVPLEFQADVVFGRYQDKFEKTWRARAFLMDGTSSTLERVLPIPPAPKTFIFNVMKKSDGRIRLHGPYDNQAYADGVLRNYVAKPGRDPMTFVRTLSVTL